MVSKRSSKSINTRTPTNSLTLQILATEHWSLLATRSQTWSEVMNRITIHLSVTSASLVVLALIAQITEFDMSFRIIAICLTTAVLLLGTLTNIRVSNASVDDISILKGMNRLRAGYIEQDPTIKKYLVTSHYDDRAGVMESYLMGVKRSLPSHIFGSTTMYMHIVNALTAGTLGALLADTAGVGLLVTSIVGILAGVFCLVCWIEVGRRSFSTEKFIANFPTPQENIRNIRKNKSSSKLLMKKQSNKKR